MKGESVSAAAASEEKVKEFRLGVYLKRPGTRPLAEGQLVQLAPNQGQELFVSPEIPCIHVSIPYHTRYWGNACLVAPVFTDGVFTQVEVVTRLRKKRTRNVRLVTPMPRTVPVHRDTAWELYLFDYSSGRDLRQGQTFVFGVESGYELGIGPSIPYVPVLHPHYRLYSVEPCTRGLFSAVRVLKQVQPPQPGTMAYCLIAMREW